MTCDRYFELLSAHLDRELTKEEIEELEQHCAGCPACRMMGAQMDELQEAFAGLEDIPAPEGFVQGVMNRIRTEEKVIPLFQRPQLRALAGLAACVVLAVGLYSTSHLNRSFDTEAGEMNIRSFSQDEPTATDGLPLQSREAQKFALDGVESYDGEAAIEPEYIAFQNDQYLLVSYGNTPEPGARIIGNTQSLKDFLDQFPWSDFSEIQTRYDEIYFASGRLLAVIVEEPSGSIRHQISELLQNQVIIEQTTPGRTADLAAWLILAEVDSTFHDGDELAVTVIPWEG